MLLNPNCKYADNTRIPKDPTVALLVQEPDGSFLCLNKVCSLKMLTAFCPHVEAVSTPGYGRSVVLTGANSQAFRAIGMWMYSCVNAKAKQPFAMPREHKYIRLWSLQKAAALLRLDDLCITFEHEMCVLEARQLPIEAITEVYNMDVDDASRLQQRVAESIGKLFWHKRTRSAYAIMHLRDEIPRFNWDVNNVMDDYYAESAARKASIRAEKGH